ncbi:interferon-induced protein with tetratricopeptide repeats 5-like [Triplophysa dalaica]|uniref:interferon-induced protein with tetratricopeptide repeats 5-like n=1 Tax=Triplophysa dalaica TaxID=1582913 RepID=UPI0024DF8FFF|nr:interferon-induced protein with tetratricopeptide repeats 5-like [Triplophysa dalaica]XP_056627910.1 interferon-induced protein with tetratricopeptide repeats 5-like [Triplophysa dalaica]
MVHERDQRTKLDQLECDFTWALRKDDIDFNRLNEKLKLHVEKKEDLTHTYNALAYVKFLQGFLEEALSNLMTSLKLYKECHVEEFHKSLIVTHGNLAWINYHMKNYTECESYLQKVLKINENMSSESSSVPEVLGEKGWTFRRFSYKYHEKSKECFKKALDLEPEVGKWNAGYAIALYRTEYGEFTIENSPVIKQLRRAIETNPDDDIFKICLALQLGIYKSYEEAERWVEKALESSPDHPDVLTYAGKFFGKKGNVDRDIALMRHALELSPYSALTHHQLALCYKKKKIQLLQKGNHHVRGPEVQQIRDKIIYHLEMATTHATGFFKAMSDLALHYGEQHDVSRAEEMFHMTFETAKEKNDNLHVVHFDYAEFQFHCKRDEVLAIKHYMECLKMNPGSYEGKRSENNLKRIAEERINKNTQVGKAYGILGFIHKEKGEKSQAIECYEKALSYGENYEYLTNLCTLRLSI